MNAVFRTNRLVFAQMLLVFPAAAASAAEINLRHTITVDVVKKTRVRGLWEAEMPI